MDRGKGVDFKEMREEKWEMGMRNIQGRKKRKKQNKRDRE